MPEKPSLPRMPADDLFHPRDFRRSLRYAGLRDSEFRVAIELSEYAAPGKPEVWPSNSAIARICNMTPEGVRKIIMRLEEKGVVICTGPSKGGRGKTTRRRLLVKTPNDSWDLPAPKPPTSVGGLAPETPNQPATKPPTRSPETPNGGWDEVVKGSRETEGEWSHSAEPHDTNAVRDSPRWQPANSETLRGRYGPRCRRHLNVEHPGACGPCGDARRADEAQQVARTRANAVVAQKRRAEIAECSDCDQNGWIETDHGVVKRCPRHDWSHLSSGATP